VKSRKFKNNMCILFWVLNVIYLMRKIAVNNKCLQQAKKKKQILKYPSCIITFENANDIQQ